MASQPYNPSPNEPFVIGTTLPNPGALQAEDDIHDPVTHGSVLYMNLTPMIDMVFNLLIFFVMVSGEGHRDAFLQSKLPRTQGQAATAAQPLTRQIELTIRRAGDGLTAGDVEIMITGDPDPVSDYRELHTRLVALRERVPADTPVVIKPRANVKYTHAVNVYNQAIRAKFSSVAFSALD